MPLHHRGSLTRPQTRIELRIVAFSSVSRPTTKRRLKTVCAQPMRFDNTVSSIMLLRNPWRSPSSQLFGGTWPVEGTPRNEIHEEVCVEPTRR